MKRSLWKRGEKPSGMSPKLLQLSHITWSRLSLCKKTPNPSLKKSILLLWIKHLFQQLKENSKKEWDWVADKDRDSLKSLKDSHLLAWLKPNMDLQRPNTVPPTLSNRFWLALLLILLELHCQQPLDWEEQLDILIKLNKRGAWVPRLRMAYMMWRQHSLGTDMLGTSNRRKLTEASLEEPPLSDQFLPPQQWQAPLDVWCQEELLLPWQAECH